MFMTETNHILDSLIGDSGGIQFMMVITILLFVVGMIWTDIVKSTLKRRIKKAKR